MALPHLLLIMLANLRVAATQVSVRNSLNTGINCSKSVLLPVIIGHYYMRVVITI